MRVPLTRRSRGHDEGAVAVLTALLAVVLLVISAFAVDFGLAYNNKRELSIAADAAVLAAGSDYALAPRRTCSGLVNDSALFATSEATADGIAARNRSGSTQLAYEVSCPDSRTLTVRYQHTRATDTTFGAVAGIDQVNATREATSAVTIATEGLGIRPYAICLADLQLYLGDLALTANVPIRTFYFPSATAGGICGDPNQGNWYTIDCPEDVGSNSSAVLAENTRNGCSDPINIVDVGTATGTAAQTILRNACLDPYDPHECLAANPGNLTAGVLDTAWNSLLGKTIAVPVFDGATVYREGGNNRRYPVKAIVGVEVCGYRWTNNSHRGLTTAGTCSGAAHPSPPSGPGAPKDWLLLRLTRIQVTGASTPGGCTFGSSECDFGARTVSLVK